MATFESPVKEINASCEAVFNRFSNLSNLEQIKDRIPQDKVKDFSFDNDSCSFSVSPIGNIGVRVIERDAFKTIKFQSEKSPIEFNLWIQILPLGETRSKVKLTIKAEVSPFIKPMVSKPLQDALNKLADSMALLPY